MDKKDIKVIIKTAVSLFLICAVATGILAFINSVTSSIITENNIAAANSARLQVLPGAVSFEEKTEADAVYYVGSDENEVLGYVFATKASGYGGEIEVMTGINTDGTITGISILSINETPGLGMNAKKDSFIEQYLGSTGPFSVIKNAIPDNNEILAMTSATITTKAVTSAVNEAIALFDAVKEG